MTERVMNFGFLAATYMLYTCIKSLPKFDASEVMTKDT